MTYNTIDQFLQNWKEIEEKTLLIFKSLTKESLTQKITEGHRDIGRICWHLILTIPEMMEKTGLAVTGPSETDPVPTQPEDLINTFKQVSKSLQQAIQ